MRPGPGLVVMALAFISGARRGSTNTSSKTTSSISSASASSSLSESSSSASPSSSFDSQLTASHFLFPFYLNGGGLLSTPANLWEPQPPQPPDIENSKRQQLVHPTYGYFYFYNKNHPPTSRLVSEDTHQRKPHQQRYQDKLSTLQAPFTIVGAPGASRETRSIDIGSVKEGVAGVFHSGGAQVEVDLGETATSEDIEEDTSDTNSITDRSSSGSSSDSSADNEATSEGLLVRFPSSSADSSRSFDEDNILALVAEDDLLSEESFDRLTKLTDDNIGYINVEEDEEDYGSSSSSKSGVALGIVVDRSNIAEDTTLPTTTPSDVETDTSSIPSIVPVTVDSADEEGQNNRGAGGDDNDDSKDIEGDDTEARNAYAANLLINNKIAAIAESGVNVKDRNDNSLIQISTDTTTTTSTDLRRSLFESESPLTRLNPWISACDLAQPGTAPDLQGQCSSGTLPMAWIDEGPGPPTCPKSCEQTRLNNKTKSNILHTNQLKFNNNNSNNKVKYLINTKMINSKISRNNKRSNSYDFYKNNNSDNKFKMIKVRRDLSEDVNIAAEAAPVTTATAAIIATATTTEIKTETSAIQETRTAAMGTAKILSTAPSSATNGVTFSAYNALNFNKPAFSYNYLKLDVNGQENSSESRKPNEANANEEDEQCLDYLGDTQETSPVHLCSLKSPNELVARLRSLRLRHCCERNVFTALHTVALNATLSGGTDCVRILTDIMDLDALATRITCELAEILFRFDCRQVYSLINQCDDCKEAYRRWVCSTLIPYFAEPNDVLLRKTDGIINSKSNNIKNTSTTSNSSNISISPNKTEVKPNQKNSFINSGSIGHKTNGFMSRNERNKRDSTNKTIKSAEGTKTSNTNTNTNIYTNIVANYNDGISSSTNSNHYITKTTRTHAVMAETTALSAQTIKNNGHKQNQQQGRKTVTEKQHQHPQEVEKSNRNFISTAINEDTSYVNDGPVISKLLKRSKRKVEFRKRRRIRPCLNVCQTVEQKCPYLLPADRAPALPTQYAGEPTFSCLDQNIPETGEQLRRSSYGPPNCCYSYCGEAASGICTYCNEFSIPESGDGLQFLNNSGNSRPRVHNYTLSITRQKQEEQINSRVSALANDGKARVASVAIALKNATNLMAALEGLPYYAYFDGTYYYDDETNDMPKEALSEHCPPVPSVTSRCTIPYYASTASAGTATQRPKSRSILLLWLSIFLCSLSGYNATQRWRIARKQNRHCHIYESPKKGRFAWIALCRQTQIQRPCYTDVNAECPKIKNINIAATNVDANTTLSNRTTLKNYGCFSYNKRSSCRKQFSKTRNYGNRRKTIRIINIDIARNPCYNSRNNKFANKPVRNSKMKNIIQKQKLNEIKTAKLFKIFSTYNVVLKFYRSRMQSSSRISKCKFHTNCYSVRLRRQNTATMRCKNSKNRNNFIKNINYHLFYHYNFNINDWWHRWWWWTRRLMMRSTRKRLRRRSFVTWNTCPCLTKFS